MDNYQHFSVSGNAAGGNTDEHDVVGEIHGGNTVEERLVSVIVIKRKQPLPPVTCKPRSSFVTKKNGHVESTLTFSRPISTLEVSLGNNEATCAMNTDGTWRIILDGVSEEDIVLSVVANGRLLPAVTLKVKTPGISKNDDPFGGMEL